MARVTSFLSWIRTEISDSALCPRSYTAPPTTTPSPCVTIEGGAVAGQMVTNHVMLLYDMQDISGSPCVFPFEVYNLTITGCTRIDGDPAAWCATQTDSQVRDQSQHSFHTFIFITSISVYYRNCFRVR